MGVMPVLLETGQVLLTESERALYEAAANSLRQSGLDIPPITESISLADYWSLHIRNAVLNGDRETVEWVSQRLEQEIRRREKPN
jgi:hypothetical protein